MQEKTLVSLHEVSLVSLHEASLVGLQEASPASSLAASLARPPSGAGLTRRDPHGQLYATKLSQNYLLCSALAPRPASPISNSMGARKGKESPMGK